MKNHPQGRDDNQQDVRYIKDPNPVHDDLWIEIDSEKQQRLAVEVHQLDGKMVYADKNTDIRSGKNRLKIPIQDLHVPQLFIVRLWFNDTIYNFKFTRK